MYIEFQLQVFMRKRTHVKWDIMCMSRDLSLRHIKLFRLFKTHWCKLAELARRAERKSQSTATSAGRGACTLRARADQRASCADERALHAQPRHRASVAAHVGRLPPRGHRDLAGRFWPWLGAAAYSVLSSMWAALCLTGLLMCWVRALFSWVASVQLLSYHWCACPAQERARRMCAIS